MAQIVLASGSPRRKELLERIGVTDFLVRLALLELALWTRLALNL